MKFHFFKRGTGAFFVILLCVFCMNCAKVPKFSIVDRSKTIEPGSIAVFCGGNSEVEIELAKEITKQFKEKSSFKVMSQKEIERRIPMYPSSFLEAQKTDTDKWSLASEHLSKKNLQTMNEIQKRLKVKYIMLVWVDGYNMQDTGCCLLGMIFFKAKRATLKAPVRVISYPGNKVIAYNNIKAIEDYSVFRSANSSLQALVEKVASLTVQNFLKEVPNGVNKGGK